MNANSPSPDRIAPEGGTGVTLLVDDQDALRGVLAHALKRNGFRVLQHARAVDALEDFSKESSIDLVITDLLMPVMSGFDLIKAIRERSPKQRILAITGQPEKCESHADLLAREQIPVLLKPFTVNQVLEAVRKALATDTES